MISTWSHCESTAINKIQYIIFLLQHTINPEFNYTGFKVLCFFKSIYDQIALSFTQTNIFAFCPPLLPLTYKRPGHKSAGCRTFKCINMWQAVNSHSAVRTRIEHQLESGSEGESGEIINMWTHRGTICLRGHTCPFYRADIWPLLTLWPWTLPRPFRLSYRWVDTAKTHKHCRAFVHWEI